MARRLKQQVINVFVSNQSGYRALYLISFKMDNICSLPLHSANHLDLTDCIFAISHQLPFYLPAIYTLILYPYHLSWWRLVPPLLKNYLSDCVLAGIENKLRDLW